MEIKKISIIGLGALGTMYGQLIANQGGEGELRIVADQERIHKLQKNGIYCNDVLCNFHYMSPEDKDPADLLIFAVKFGQLPEAIKAATKQVGENTTILSVLNGISSEEYLAEVFGKDKVLLCTAQGMDAVKEDNRVVYHNLGYLCLGTWDNKPSKRLEEVTHFLDRIQLPYQLPEDMTRQLWNKLMLNVGVNQVAAVYETNYGGLQQEGEPREMMLLAMKEVLEIARARDINLKEQDIEDWMKVLGRLDPKGMPSMRQDTLAHRPTEVELFAGTILRLGQECNIATPINEMLYQRMKEIEAHGE